MNIGLKVAAGFLAFWVLRWVGVPIETFLTLLVVWAIGWPVGWIIGSRIQDGADVDNARYKTIGWANLVLWIIPIAGVIGARLSSSVGQQSTKNEFFYDGMSVIGYGLVIANVAFSVPLLMDEANQAESSEVFAEYGDAKVLPPGERSFARCPYAAAEGWSQIEVEIYCNREPTEEDLMAFELEQQRLKAAAD